MSNEQLFETEMHIQYGLMQQGKDHIDAINDAVITCTGLSLSNSEKDVFNDTFPEGFREFLDWVINKIKQFIQWLKDWLEN